MAVSRVAGAKENRTAERETAAQGADEDVGAPCRGLAFGLILAIPFWTLAIAMTAIVLR